MTVHKRSEVQLHSQTGLTQLGLHPLVVGKRVATITDSGPVGVLCPVNTVAHPIIKLHSHIMLVLWSAVASCKGPDTALRPSIYIGPRRKTANFVRRCLCRRLVRTRLFCCNFWSIQLSIRSITQLCSLNYIWPAVHHSFVGRTRLAQCVDGERSTHALHRDTADYDKHRPTIALMWHWRNQIWSRDVN